MATAHLICGFIGSGKTTFARQLESDIGAVRFTHDEWMVRLYGHNPPDDQFQDMYEKISALIWDESLQVLKRGQDIILDFGFWKRSARDEARQNLTGFPYEFYLVVCDEDVAWARVDTRNKDLGSGDLLIERMTFDTLKQKIDRFGEDENFIIVHSENVQT